MTDTATAALAALVAAHPHGIPEGPAAIHFCPVPGCLDIWESEATCEHAGLIPDQAAEKAGTRARLPHWVEQRHGYSGSVFLKGVMLGFERAKWPVQAFAVDVDGGCSMGARWVAEKPQDRVLVGPVPIPDDVPVRSAKRVPERFELTDD